MPLSPAPIGSQPWTPTLTGTGWAIGNATVDAAYAKVGKIVWFRIFVTWGSTSTYGTGVPAFSLPSTMYSTASGSGTAQGLDIGVNAFLWDANFATTTRVQPAIRGTNGASTGGPSGTSPIPWTTGDQLMIAGWYEEA